MTLIDLAGQKFGRLTVIDRAPTRTTPSGQRRTYWHCICECGVRNEVESQNLRTAKVQSCGCLSSDRAKERAHDLTGQRFGRLVVTGRASSSDYGSATWSCRCDCGTEKEVAAPQLKGGVTMSCGCLRAILSAHRRWQGDDATYLAVHDRLRNTRGPARSHACVECGGTAREWSYSGASETERFEFVHGYWLAFTTDLENYAPRCSKCHRRHDRNARKGRAS